MKDIRCLLGKHTGQANGGTMMYTCPRCHRDFWQAERHRHHLRVVEQQADLLISLGRLDEAREYARREVKKTV